MLKKLKVLILIVFVCGGAFLFTRSSHMQTVAPQTAQVLTAGQKFKNIKVLNDMPADQLGKVMNIFSASLGVNCAFCHISGDGDFDKDGKKEKEAARKMISMTLALNKNYFDSHLEISCNTCHRGHEHPQSAFILPLPAPALEGRPAEAKEKPTIDAILDNYVKALGGKDALDKIKTRTIKARRIESDGKTMETENVSLKAPNKSLVITGYEKYVVTEAYDGTRAWKRANADDIELHTDEAEQIKREADLFQPANIKSMYAQIGYAATDKIGDRDVYIVRATTTAGLRERLYFDVLTGLLARRAASIPTVIGNFQYQVDYEDYKAFDGVKIPMTTRWSMPNLSWTRKVLEVKNNTPIDDGKFVNK